MTEFDKKLEELYYKRLYMAKKGYIPDKEEIPYSPPTQEEQNLINKLIIDFSKESLTDKNKKLLEMFGYTVRVDPIDLTHWTVCLEEYDSYKSIDDRYKSIDDRIKNLDTIPDILPTKEEEQILKDIREKSKKTLDKLNFRDQHGNKTENCETEINFKLTIKEKEQIKQKSKEYGFKNLSDYMRIVLLNTKIDVIHDTKTIYDEEKDIYHYIERFSKVPSEQNARILKTLVEMYTVFKLTKTKE